MWASAATRSRRSRTATPTWPAPWRAKGWVLSSTGIALALRGADVGGHAAGRDVRGRDRLLEQLVETAAFQGAASTAGQGVETLVGEQNLAIAADHQPVDGGVGQLAQAEHFVLDLRPAKPPPQPPPVGSQAVPNPQHSAHPVETPGQGCAISL